MPSGTSTFNYNRDQIIRAALRKIGAIASGETPDASTTQDCSDALNAMVKEWEADGIHVWTETQATLFLQPGQVKYQLGGPTGSNISPDNATSSYITTTLAVPAALGAFVVQVASITGIQSGDNIGITLDSGQLFWTTVNGAPGGNSVPLTASLPDSASTVGFPIYDYTTKIVRPLRVPFARRFNFPSQILTPMIWMSRSDYFDLPNPNSTGIPTQFFYDPQLSGGFFYVWPAPSDITNGVTFTMYRPIQDFNVSGDTPDLPQEWISTLVFNLACEMAPEYGLPLDQLTKLQEIAALKLQRLAGWDREPEPTMFQVDFQRMNW